MATGDFVNHHDGSSLIVGFPQVPRQRGEYLQHHAVGTTDADDSSATTAVTHPMMKRSKVKSVSFSAISELVVVPSKSKQELAAAWHSKEERTRLKKGVLRNAAEVTRMLELETGPDYHLTEEDLCKTIGMESFLNPRLMRISKDEKHRHAQSIVFAQARFGDPALLSKLSKRSSLPSRQRARERALSQF